MNSLAAIQNFINSNLEMPLNELFSSSNIKSIHGTVVGDTPPEDTKYLWVDTSTENASLKFYDDSTGTWKPINIGSGGGTGTTNSNMDVELDSDIEE